MRTDSTNFSFSCFGGLVLVGFGSLLAHPHPRPQALPGLSLGSLLLLFASPPTSHPSTLDFILHGPHHVEGKCLFTNQCPGPD